MDLKQREIAKKIKVNRMSYSYWETGTRFIPLNTLNEYCNIFNVSMDYIFYLSNVNNKNIIKVKSLDKVLIGKRIKEILKENKITQIELANMLNTTQSTISAYINGKTLILTAFAYGICKNYNISLDWLCGRSNKKTLK